MTDLTGTVVRPDVDGSCAGFGTAAGRFTGAGVLTAPFGAVCGRTPPKSLTGRETFFAGGGLSSAAVKLPPPPAPLFPLRRGLIVGLNLGIYRCHLSWSMIDWTDCGVDGCGGGCEAAAAGTCGGATYADGFAT